jgi:hypothetical protein
MTYQPTITTILDFQDNLNEGIVQIHNAFAPSRTEVFEFNHHEYVLDRNTTRVEKNGDMTFRYYMKRADSVPPTKKVL